VVWNQDATKTKSRDDIADTIVNNSQGVFQWARAVIPMVRDELNEGQSPSKVLKMLKEVPEELETLYKHILTNVIKARYRRQTLLLMQWISFATRPLTMTEWRYAMSLGDADEYGSQSMLEESDEFVDDDDRMGLLTATLSGGLAEVTYHKYSEGAEFTKVQFVHQSVKEYMDGGGLSLLLSQVDTECRREENVFAYSSQRLAQACMNYLSFDEVAATDGGEEAYDGLPFLEYACASWSEHLMEAEKMGLPQHRLIKYFENHKGRFLKWSQLFYSNYRRVVGEDTATTWKYSHLIHLASDYNIISVVRRLLDSGVSADEANSCSQRPLHYAALGGNTEIIAMLLDFGADPASVNRRGNTPLELAARNGHGDVVRLLLEKGADVDTEGSNGSALCAAAYAGKKHTVRMLLSNGGNVNQQSGTLGNPLQWASFGNAHFEAWPEVMQICLDFGADVNAAGGKYGNALQAASHKGDVKAVELLLNAGAEVNAKGGEYRTALQAASCSWTGSIELVALLLEHGALVNEQGGYYGNALIAASCKGHADIVNLLLEQGADIYARGGLFDNCIQAAAYGNSLEIVEMLLKRGAEANLLGGKNGNSMHAAAVDSGPKELISVLIRAGADVNSEGGEYGYPLQAASYGRQLRNIEAVQFLLDSGAHVNAQGGKFGNALQAAARAGSARIVEMLIRNGADVNAKGGAYGSALGAVKDDVEGRAVKRLLIAAGACDSTLASSGSIDIEMADMILPQP
jgi:ankyrin repeat protein